MKQYILGTAGHIDHGKTSLVKALTGIDTDRLKEEKERGITIELGFAFIDLPNQFHLSIVDVPGHERFVKNMVSGATGIDFVAMVIAADEGIMPQTREHMEICTLLGIQYGLVVLTKIDLVDDDWLELIHEDISQFCKDTFLENAPIVPVSAITGQGLSDLKDELVSICSVIPEKKNTGLFRLPIDRVFTMKGFGTVITGTLISGEIKNGATIMVYPAGTTAKIRGLQVHNHQLDEVRSGMRVAINFQGLEKTLVNRGDVIAKPDELKPSTIVDVFLNYLPSNLKSMKHRMQVRFHTGTSEIFGYVYLLDKDEVNPGESAYAQIRLETSTVSVKDDRFVLRSYSPVHTIGGGYILNPIPEKHKRHRSDIIEGLKCLHTSSSEQVLLYHARNAHYQGISVADLRIMTTMSQAELQSTIEKNVLNQLLILSDKEHELYIHQHSFIQLKSEIRSHLHQYHKNNPMKSIMLKEELKSKLPDHLSQRLFNWVLIQMEEEGLIVQEGKGLRLTAHKISMGIDQERIKQNILNMYTQYGLQPPYFKDICAELKIDVQKAKDILFVLVADGVIVKVKDDLYFSSDSVEKLKLQLINYLKKNSEINTSQFKELSGVSRKYAIPLIEYFDTINFTIRVGDNRQLRN
ncbi:MAG: selenocysteine-specific translation elongation factor [Desulfobacterales bacterium]|nr:selenocysteine-specific translation elongation factor [Desulfobacterales bacterium]